MPHKNINKATVNIYNYPNEIEQADVDQLTIGDLHANAMLFMYFLVSHGVAKISDEHYNKLTSIYIKNARDLTQKDISEFNKVVDGLEFEVKPLIRLIGDEICDRGQNDYFIFKLLKKLKQCKVPIEILLSNHGIEFLLAYEKNQQLSAQNMNVDDQVQSLNHLRLLIDNDMVSRRELDFLVETIYKPSLKLISYSLYQDSITIYSHAGIGLETIKSLCDAFKEHPIAYQDETIEELAKTIEEINEVFSEYVHNGTVHQIAGHLSLQAGDPYRITDPLIRIIWNRSYENLERDEKHNHYKLFFVHGHDSGESTYKNIFNLDGNLGKKSNWNIGNYQSLASNGKTLNQF